MSTPAIAVHVEGLEHDKLIVIPPALSQALDETLSEMREGKLDGFEFYLDEPLRGRRMSKIEAALRAARNGTGPMPKGYRFKRPKRVKYPDLQALRRSRGTGRPVKAIVLPIPTDLVQI